MGEKVQGNCPACGFASLFLGSGGYVTCSIMECRDPGLASQVLELGRIADDLLRSGAQIHHINDVREELRGLVHHEPFCDQDAKFITKLMTGRPWHTQHSRPKPSGAASADDQGVTR